MTLLYNPYKMKALYFLLAHSFCAISAFEEKLLNTPGVP